jgi:hypothetical protein
MTQRAERAAMPTDTPEVTQMPLPLREALKQAMTSLLDLHETLKQAFAQAQPETQPGDPPQRFPRRPLELMILEALEAIAPMPVTPVQMTVLINQPHAVVRDTLNALAVLGTIQHLRAGYYSHGPAVGDVPFRSRKKGGDRPPPSEVQLPSARIVAQSSRQGSPADPAPGADEGQAPDGA